MPTISYIVHDVDDALPFYEALGFRMRDRPGPPIVILEREGLTLRVAGPGASASRELPGGG